MTGTSKPTCIAPVQVDGGTRFRWEVDPGVFTSPIGQADADGVAVSQAPPVFRALLTDLRMPSSRESEKRWRESGGRVCLLPQPQLGLWSRHLAAQPTVSGGRRELVRLNVPAEAWVSINVETGDVRLKLHAPSLWANGYELTASRWIHLVTWWLTGRHIRLEQAFRLGWTTTGIELCSDFTGLSWSETDVPNFLGYRRTDKIRTTDRHAKLQTIDLGTRSSPISACLYDKDEQIAAKLRGDDSCYRATHLANGWDGVSPRQRVEFRVTGRALDLEDETTGEVIQTRDPAAIASRDTLCSLWAFLCSKKRLILPDSAAKRTNAKTDPRWSFVLSAAGLPEYVSFRQTRRTQTDAWTEAVKRARRDATRALRRVAALHDVRASAHEDSEVIGWLEATSTSDERDALVNYHAGYRLLREPFVGPEISSRGRKAWREAFPEYPDHLFGADLPNAGDV